MDDLRYILAEPIHLEKVGQLHHLGILEYSRNISYFDVLSVTINLLLQQVDDKDIEKREYIESYVKNFDIIIHDQNSLSMLIKLLSLCFKVDESKFKIEKGLDGYSFLMMNSNIIDRDNYDFVRDQIIKINRLHLPKQAKTKELQKWYDLARKAKSKEGSNVDLEDIITTLHVITGTPYSEIKNMTVYQINRSIERVNKIKEYETNIQFICAGGGKGIKLDSYLAHIEEEMEEKLSTSFDAWKKQYEGVLTT